MGFFMILGIGTDILEIARIEKSILNDDFLNKVFTEKEINFAKNKARSSEIFAGTFCAKEAISKAFGRGIRGFNFTDIEVLRDELGKPYYVLYGKAKEIANKMGVKKTFLTISHSKNNCVAFCVLEG